MIEVSLIVMFEAKSIRCYCQMSFQVKRKPRVRHEFLLQCGRIDSSRIEYIQKISGCLFLVFVSTRACVCVYTKQNLLILLSCMPSLVFSSFSVVLLSVIVILSLRQNKRRRRKNCTIFTLSLSS